MPEGPEVRCITVKLHERLQSQYLNSIQWDDKSKYRNGLLHYAELEKRLPQKITGVSCKGKKIIFQLENEMYITSTLGLEGNWSWKPSKHANLYFELTDSEEKAGHVYFSDSRHFGNIQIFLSTNALLDDLNLKIGPDLLAYAIDYYNKENEAEPIPLELWKTRINRYRAKQICEFLMDQKIFSGIGNYLKAEILYRAKIRPNRLLRNLTDAEIVTLYWTTLETIYEAFFAGGLTIKSFWDPDGKRGTFSKVVYGSKQDLLGNPVIQQTFKDGRTTHWVPAVQT